MNPSNVFSIAFSMFILSFAGCGSSKPAEPTLGELTVEQTIAKAAESSDDLFICIVDGLNAEAIRPLIKQNDELLNAVSTKIEAGGLTDSDKRSLSDAVSELREYFGEVAIELQSREYIDEVPNEMFKACGVLKSFADKKK